MRLFSYLFHLAQHNSIIIITITLMIEYKRKYPMFMLHRMPIFPQDRLKSAIVTGPPLINNSIQLKQPFSINFLLYFYMYLK